MRTDILRPVATVESIVVGLPRDVDEPSPEMVALVEASRPAGPDETPTWGPKVDPEVAVPLISAVRRARFGPDSAPWHGGFDPTAPEHVRGELAHHLNRLAWALEQVGAWLPTGLALRARAALAAMSANERACLVFVVPESCEYPRVMRASDVLIRVGNNETIYASCMDWVPHHDFDGDADNEVEPVRVTLLGADVVDWVVDQVCRKMAKRAEVE